MCATEETMKKICFRQQITQIVLLESMQMGWQISCHLFGVNLHVYFNDIKRVLGHFQQKL